MSNKDDWQSTSPVQLWLFPNEKSLVLNFMLPSYVA
ncbi:hypothetical protein BCF11_2526 [Collimonas sp. PA-H2]|nr:hypothetical protein BCF11_2526 [Collimonas sp. PA-H2]